MHAWLKENLQGVTWKRFGIFFLLSIWNTLASWPAARAYFFDGGLVGAIQPFIITLSIYLFSYGLALLVMVVVGNRVSQQPGRWILPFVVAIVLGGLICSILFALAFPESYADGRTYSRFFRNWSFGLFEAGIMGAVFMFLIHRDQTANLLRQEEVDRMELDQTLMQSRLQVLQSQIEPHFLFNTVANIRWLMQTDRTAGKAMLQQFSTYVEAALPQLRDARSSLGRELALATAYLNVQAIRMGDRLAISIKVPDPLNAATFPPMMLLTLVENAIKHGISPLPQGGNITIQATAPHDRLVIRVTDSGIGLKANSGSGIGIANIRNRLFALYRHDARLAIAQNPIAGVTATIEVPLAYEQPDPAQP